LVVIVAGLLVSQYSTTMSAQTRAHIAPTTDDLSLQLAEYVTKLSRECIASNGKFNVAISGGSLPGLLASKLKNPPFIDKVEWANWVVWFVDERYVPLDHNDSNFKEAKKLFDSVSIPKNHIHTAKVELPIEECAKEYQQQLQAEFGSEHIPKLDLVLLGLGPDGHTASLFPNHKLLKEQTKWVAHIDDSPKPPPHRITLTIPVINNGKNIAFVATGDSKKDMVLKVLEDDTVPWGSLPAKLVAPSSGNLIWFLDAEAAKLLKKSYL